MTTRIARIGGAAVALLVLNLAVPAAGPDGQSVAGSRTRLGAAVERFDDGRVADALPVFEQFLADPELGGYARLYAGRAHLALGRPSGAAEAARVLMASGVAGYLREAALWLAADAAESAGDLVVASRALQGLSESRPLAPEKAVLRLARASAAAGDEATALTALTRVYYEYPLTPEAAEAAAELKKFLAPAPISSAGGTARELARAQILFDAKRYADAREAFDPLAAGAIGDDRALIELRIAESDYYLKRYQLALNGLQPHVNRPGPRQTEAQYFYLGVMRDLGRGDEYVAVVRSFVDAHPADLLAEDALNSLATYYVLLDDDGKAAEVLGELLRKFPTGPHADRAAWRVGWWAFKNNLYADTVRVFERAAATFPRADYRPSWLYWAARAHAKLGERESAAAGFRQVIANYCNSYYGREAERELDALVKAGATVDLNPRAPERRELAAPPVIGALPPTAAVVKSLLSAGMYNDALNELRTLQRQNGPSPAIDATMAYALNKRGDLRPAITAMRRAYPQFMAEGGERLPADVLSVIFPLAYWDVIRTQAVAHKLDPFLMAALVAQESTFDADIRSSANAWGLMQVLPATGRQYARTLGISPFRTTRLIEPLTNVRIGMAYFADLMKQFGGVAPALAAYNAGGTRVSRWLAERPGLPRDEFIDDIPFPETQNYVKRVLGTAEDYRRLYAPAPPAATRQR